MQTLNPPPKTTPFSDPETGVTSNAWYSWALDVARFQASGVSGTFTLAKITGGGSPGSVTFTNGLITGFVAPT